MKKWTEHVDHMFSFCDKTILLELLPEKENATTKSWSFQFSRFEIVQPNWSMERHIFFNSKYFLRFLIHLDEFSGQDEFLFSSDKTEGITMLLCFKNTAVYISKFFTSYILVCAISKFYGLFPNKSKQK